LLFSINEQMDLMEITKEYLNALNVGKLIKRDVGVRPGEDILAVIGPRRVGKTFSMLLEVRNLLNTGEKVIYAPMDEPKLSTIDKRDFAAEVRKVYPEGRVYLFLDEVQEWVGWDANLRWLHDVRDFRIAVSGSSSTLLASEIPTRLRGRYVSRILLPISFSEMTRSNVETFRDRGRILRALEDYLKWGGFPEVLLTRSREKIYSLFETIFYRDIVDRFGVRNRIALKMLISYILENYALPMSYRRILNSLRGFGLDIELGTLIQYVSHLQDALMVFVVEAYAPSWRRRMVSPKKVYLVDPSLAQLGEWRKPQIVENVVYLELLRRYRDGIYYYKRNDLEVDFVVARMGKPELLIEVCMEPDNTHVKKLLRAMERLSLKRGTMVSWGEEDEYLKGDRVVKIVPLWKWLTEKGNFS